MKRALYLILGSQIVLFYFLFAETDSLKVKEGKRFIMIIAPRAFRDEEFRVPYEFLTKIGHRVKVASRDTILATGMLGLALKPQLTIKEIDTLNYDGLILVGGTGASIYWDDPIVHRLVKHFASKPNKIAAAICIAPITFARAGILKGKKATVFQDRFTLNEFKKYGVIYVKSDVVVSDNIITASGPDAAMNFAKAIATKIGKIKP
ncbi:MAG: DJ-1/PfpI family protein [candidate division WOR-3 bacterium]|nr:DJ-1/PfpI family protein [candidate division WOR-3 bacterium]